MYNVLPYIEESALHDLGKGLVSEDGAARRSAIVQAIETVVPIFYCPTRRTAEVRPFMRQQNYFNLGSTHRPKVVARNDYAACAGDGPTTGTFFAGMHCAGPNRNSELNTYECWDERELNKMNGITVMRNSGLVRTKSITDGLSKTLLYGEKYLRMETYEATEIGNNQGWNLGFAMEINRYCKESPYLEALRQPSRYFAFGSAHPGGMQCAMADGSVHTITYDIDREAFRRLGVRNDALPVAVP
jgi:prepilin-type processing-associated H-X9-DG protein